MEGSTILVSLNMVNSLVVGALEIKDSLAVSKTMSLEIEGQPE